MLHPVPDSTQRARMLEVVAMQTTLIEALCGLPEGSSVDQAWLEGIWSSVPAEWIQRFLRNDKGNRATWIAAIAAASTADKRTILDRMVEQHRFAELYDNPATVRLTNHNWSLPLFAAVKKLLVSFYAPLFYQDEGFPNANGTRFHKEHFIDPKPWVCPYTDNFIQDSKLDHFLPKDQFPMLSCHPDNLIPCSTDANSGGHKGNKIPLSLVDQDQAGAWFHPRWRSANDTYRLTFVSALDDHQQEVQFVAHNTTDQPRLDNLESIFGLSEFWGRFIANEVQSVANDVEGLLELNGTEPTQANVRSYIRLRALQERRRIGRQGLAIVKSFFYEHIAQTPSLLAQVVRACTHGT